MLASLTASQNLLVNSGPVEANLEDINAIDVGSFGVTKKVSTCARDFPEVLAAQPLGI